MFLHSAITSLQSALQLDVVLFLPELILCAAIVLLLFLRLFAAFDRWHLGLLTLGLTVAALVVAALQWRNRGGLESPEAMNSIAREQLMFSGLLVYDTFTVFLRIFLFGFAALLVWLSMLTGIPDREDSGDFYCLLLGATVGMSLMASANHLLMVYIGVEMASLPSYALAGFLKGRRQGSEAALKYVVYGGGAAGIMLYGISLLAGTFGTAYLPDLARGLASALTAPGATFDPMLLLGVFFILVGFGFKLAAVPFHFWCPDVFEGAAAEVAAFLSVASKGAALALLGRFAFTIAGLADKDVQYAAWYDVSRFLCPALALFAMVTATFGNLAAYAQTNLKRLLAYSTIAHAGYMMMGVATLTREGVSAVLFYLIAYLFMNLGAFAVVAFLRNQTGSEDLAGYRGMIYRAPLMTVTLAIFLLSLLGMPPLGGFAAKLQVFGSLVEAGNQYSAAGLNHMATWMYATLAVGCLNTVLSAVYYIKVLKVMILDRDADKAAEPLAVPFGPAVYATLLAVLLLAVGLAWNPLMRLSDRGTNRFRQAPLQETVTQVQS